jgi:hypothetical protein
LISCGKAEWIPAFAGMTGGGETSDAADTLERIGGDDEAIKRYAREA